MANSIIMPKTGMAMEEGVIVEWLIKEGDRIAKGDVVALIETDKSTMELESDYDGVILAILNQTGDTVPVTKVIAWVGQEGEAVPASTETTGIPQNESGAASVTAPAGASTGVIAAVSTVESTGQTTGIRATPAARTLAKEQNIDLRNLAPGGSHGEIRKSDVLQSRPEGKQTVHTPLTVVPLPKTDRKDTRVALTKIQQITGRRMSESRQAIPEVTSHIKADVTRMLQLRQELNDAMQSSDTHTGTNIPAKITINDFILIATVKTLLVYPRLNSVLDGNELIYKGSINLGIAAATERGLVVPVIHDAQDYSLIGLSCRTAELAAKAREGTLKSEEMTGSTFTVSNIGMYGITAFTPIINPPEAAILGVCAVEDVLKLEEEKVVNRKIIGLSLAFDHRIVDGAESSMFLKTLKDTLEAPLLILL
jgi:pyruvate dehydrogenase E2 component (dihydrolipoamide acetyltransferase)